MSAIWPGAAIGVIRWGVPKPIPLILATLALAAASGVAAAAPSSSNENGTRVESPVAPEKRETGAREDKAKEKAPKPSPRRGRRAKLDTPAVRAPRGVGRRNESDAKASASKQAVSIGWPNDGRLENGVHLDVSKSYLHAIPGCLSGDYLWGVPSLVDMIDRAARSVDKRFPGAVLNIGDISQKGGGDVLGHHSHESGRDADIGFYVTDAKGQPMKTAHFVKFEGSLVSKTVRGARFDLARNWQLVQEMLTDPRARVSHIFIANPLRQKLLAYAKERGVSQSLLNRAAVVMMQPTGSLPHDDHMHVRISCPSSMHGTCIELAKNAAARRKNRTASRKAPEAKKPRRSLPRSHRAAPRSTAVAEAAAPNEDFVIELPPEDSADLRDDAVSDAIEGASAVDESGTVKITD